MTPDFFTSAMDNLADYYGNTMITKDERQMKAWWNFLCFYPDEIVGAAMMHMMDTVAAFPSIQMVRSYIMKMSQTPWETAYSEAKEKARQLKYPVYVDGLKQEVTFSDPLIIKCLEVIGINEFLNCPESQANFMRSSFQKTYESLQSRKHMEHIMNFATSGALNPVMMLVSGNTSGLNKIRLALESRNG